MSLSLNKQILIGNLGKDAEVSEFQAGKKVAKFSVATTRSWKNQSTGDWKNETDWHNCVKYEPTDFEIKSLKKGSKFYVEGYSKKREWDDKDGIKRNITEVIVNTLIPLESNRQFINEGTNPDGSNTSTSNTDNTGSWEDLREKDDDPLPF